jgi:hypothetical protein
MARSLPMVSTEVSLAKVAVVDSGEVGISAVYIRYNDGPRTLLWGTPALTEESSVYWFLSITRKCLLVFKSYVYPSYDSMCPIVECLCLNPN